MSLARDKLAALQNRSKKPYLDYFGEFMDAILTDHEALLAALIDPLQATSDSEITIGVGTHTFDRVGTDKRFQLGDRVKMAAEAGTKMFGDVVSYTPGTAGGRLIVGVTEAGDVEGAGTFDAWSISAALGYPGTSYWLPLQKYAADQVLSDRAWAIFNSAAAERQGTLPANPVAGTRVMIARLGANDVWVRRNGQTIMGQAADYRFNKTGQGAVFEFDGTTWLVHSPFKIRESI